MKTRLWDFWAGVMREGEGAAAGGAGAGANNNPDSPGGSGSGAGGAGAGGDGQQPGAPPAAYYPETLPEAFRGKDNNETIDKLVADLTGRPKAPEKADDYKFDPGEDFTKKWGELKDDKVLAGFRGIAHEVGMDNAAFNTVIQKFYGMLETSGVISAPPDPKQMVMSLAPAGGDDATRASAGARRVMDAEAFVSGLETKGLPKDGVMALSGLLDSVEGVQTIEFIQRLANVKGVQPGGQPGAGPTGHEKALQSMYPSMFKG